MRDNEYSLSCHYGIGKPNTNGFMNGGKKIELKGNLKKVQHYYLLQNAGKTLSVAELNEDLLHLSNPNNSLLVGNAGWSYILNSIKPSRTDQVSLTSTPTAFKDSMTFQGRTPCAVPGIIPSGTECYKLKWYLVLYGNGPKKDEGKYKVFGTPWREKGGRTGKWKITTGKNGRIIYQLNDENGKGFIYLLKLDDNVLVFTDAQGRLLVGDEDFSYTLNRSE